MKLANCNEHPDANDQSIPCWALRRDDGRRVTADEMFEIIHAIPNLEPVISWLENGRDPKEAAKELRIYQHRIHDLVSS